MAEQSFGLKAVSQSLRVLSLDNDVEGTGLLDTDSAVSEMLDSLETLPTNPPSLFIDIEGENLSRHGTISILQLHVLPSGQRFLG